jgi:hypothetical protein
LYAALDSLYLEDHPHSSYRVEEMDDPFAETWAAAMINNHLPQLEPRAGIRFCLMLTWKHGTKDTAITLVITYKSIGRWLFIKKEGSLVLLIDGKRRVFNGMAASERSSVVGLSPEDRVKQLLEINLLSGDERKMRMELLETFDKEISVTEQIFYKMDRKTVSLIAHAHEVRGKLYGSRGDLEFIMDERYLNRILRFARTYKLVRN